MKPIVRPRRLISLYSIVSLGAVLLCGVPSALAQQGHTLIAQYTFDNSGSVGADSSGNNNNINGGSSWGGIGQTQFSTNAIAGGGADNGRG